MKNIRLFWQIFPVSLVITLISLFLIGWFAASIQRSFYTEQTYNSLESRAELLKSTLSAMTAGSTKALNTFVRNTGRHGGVRITVVDNSGKVLADSNEDAELMENHADRPELKTALSGFMGHSIRFSNTLGKSMLYVAIPMRLQPSEKTGAIRVSISREDLEAVLYTLRQKLIIAGLVIVALATLFSLIAAKRIIKPLEDMKRAAEELAKGESDQLVKIDNNHMSVELASLAGTLNLMAEQINRRIRIIIQQRNELEAVFSSMSEAVIAIDADKKIIRMNRAASSFFEINAEATKGKTIHGIIRNQELLELINTTLAKNVIGEEKITLFSGTSPIVLHTHTVPLRDETEKNMGVLVVMNDLTKMIHLEKIRQDFVANVSHELKTPITAIKGYIETVLDGAIDDREDALRFLNIAGRQANRLDAIVDDLLTLSRIENKTETGELHLSLSSIYQILEAAKQTCAVQADEKNITITIECDNQLRAALNTPLLEQALINLLTNSISYSPQKTTIVLRAGISDASEEGALLYLSVIDEGQGIAKEHLPRLFERFYRCDKGRGRNKGGTGLGLAIVKHIAQSHKGSVEVLSTPGKGSTFTLTLPLPEEPV